MAFACRPSLIVLDEPTTGLDVTTQRHVLDTVRNLCSAYGVAASTSATTSPSSAGSSRRSPSCTPGVSSSSGRPRGCSEIRFTPTRAGLLAAIPSPERSELLRGIEGQPPRPGRRPTGCFFAPRCELAVAGCAQPQPLIEVADRQVRCFGARARWSHGAPLQGNRFPSGPPTGGSVLEVPTLKASYGRVEVLHDVTLKVPADCCVAVVGESGSGKTTLARMHRRSAHQLHRELTFQRLPARSRDARQPAEGIAAPHPVHLPEPLHLAQSPQDDRPDHRSAARALLRPVPLRAGGSRRPACSRTCRSRADFMSPVPGPALRRRTTEGRDRPGPRRRARAARLRRGDLRTGRLGAGGHRRAAPSPAVASATSP